MYVSIMTSFVVALLIAGHPVFFNANFIMYNYSRKQRNRNDFLSY